MSDPETTRKTTRVQLELAPVSMARLKRLKHMTGAASYAEVIRNAIRFYEPIVEVRRGTVGDRT